MSRLTGFLSEKLYEYLSPCEGQKIKIEERKTKWTEDKVKASTQKEPAVEAAPRDLQRKTNQKVEKRAQILERKKAQVRERGKQEKRRLTDKKESVQSLKQQMIEAQRRFNAATAASQGDGSQPGPSGLSKGKPRRDSKSRK